VPPENNRDDRRTFDAGAYPHVRQHPPKYSVAFETGFIKGKSAVRIHRHVLGKSRVTALHFWSREYCVSTVGLNEEAIKKYIRDQETLEKRQGESEFNN
jgi:putative transposase